MSVSVTKPLPLWNPMAVLFKPQPWHGVAIGDQRPGNRDSLHRDRSHRYGQL
jgi:hypothetical protein